MLERIIDTVRRNVREATANGNVKELERRAAAHVPRGFRQALRAKSANGIAVIAELKKASPSRGLIRADFDAAVLARELEAAGATALSVLTDVEFFQGSLENLRRASAAVSAPCLRKDFIIDEFQVLEARANCADAVLLIVAALKHEELSTLSRSARGHGLDVLCEVHDEEELQRAQDAGCELIGVNSRNLKTFEVNLETVLRLAGKFPENVVRVAESGIHTAEDIATLQRAGYHAFLIGESLMRSPHPGETLQELLKSGIQSEARETVRT